MRRLLFVLSLILCPFVAAPPGFAQTPSADAAFAAEKAAFLGLPLATRKAAQDALVWLGLYNG
ncbi:MAG TPA: hypothetical protein VMS87_10185, partial [Roseiarcus sp.]|nr:hypothetical protein [Roseiarcus sp.]